MENGGGGGSGFNAHATELATFMSHQLIAKHAEAMEAERLLHRQQHAEAMAAAFNRGFDAGDEHGYSRGRNEAMAAAFNRGFNAGGEHGYNRGRNETVADMEQLARPGEQRQRLLHLLHEQARVQAGEAGEDGIALWCDNNGVGTVHNDRGPPSPATVVVSWVRTSGPTQPFVGQREQHDAFLRFFQVHESMIHRVNRQQSAYNAGPGTEPEFMPLLRELVKKHPRTMLLAKNTDRLFRTCEQGSRCFAELNALQVEIVLYGERRSRIHNAQEQWEVRVSAAALESAIRSQRRLADGAFPADNIWKGTAAQVE
jgi:hypothetical protein